MDGPREVGGGFRNWNNAISNGFRTDFKSRFRRISYNTIVQTHLQDQILREMIKNKEHLGLTDIVAMDIEYGGGRTVPRISIVNFHEEVLYYTDFCMRYEDWVETKMTEANEEDMKIDANENAQIYQNSYQRKKPSVKKGEDGNVITNKNEEDADFSDGEIQNMEQLEQMEREEMEDEELVR